MAKPKKQRIVHQFAGAQEQFKNRALERAKRVPWPRLVAAVDQYNEWQVFSLWVRAVVDAAKSTTPGVEQELESRIPGFLARVENDIQAALADKPGHRLWSLVDSWVTSNVLLEPKVQGWLDSVHYFASMSLPYMKTWAHWEQVNEEWRRNTPAAWPAFGQWQLDVAAVTRLPNPESAAQQVLDAVRSIPPAKWDRIRFTFFDLIGFSLWMELIMDLEGPRSKIVVDEIGGRYDGFRFSCPDLPSSDAVRELNVWAVEHAIGTKDQKLLAALSWHVQHHPAYYAMRNYAVHCHDVWPDDYPNPLPSFDEWRRVTENTAF